MKRTLLIFDDNQMNEHFVASGRRMESFRIGKLFIDFLDVDFDFYELKYGNPDQILNKHSKPKFMASDSYEKTEHDMNILLEAYDKYFNGIEHPYFMYSNITNMYMQFKQFGNDQNNYDISILEERISNLYEEFWIKMKRMQADLRKAAQICLDIDYDDGFISNSPIVRFWEGKNRNLFSLSREYLNAEIEYFPEESNEVFKAIYEKKIPEIKISLSKKDREMLGNMNTFGFSTLNPLSIAFAEFSKMVDLKIWIKKCSNCGHYFVLGKNRKKKYCNVKRADYSAACNKIGAAIKEKKKDNEPLHKAKTQADNRINAMSYRGHQIDVESLRSKAKNLEKLVQSGEISKEVAIAELKKIATVKRKSRKSQI